MSEKILFLVIVLLSTTHANGLFRYDYVYNKEVEGWLKLHTIPSSFNDAFLQCDFEGAVLASPLNDKYHKMLQSVQSTLNQDCGMYTGIHSTISHGDYTSVGGVPLARMPVTWSAGEPDNFEDQERCLVMAAGGALADVRCNETFPFACFKKKTKNLVITECGTVDTAYKLDKRTGSCYKFHRVGMTWRRAQKVCLAEGGHLAIINSENEASVIKDLFAKNPASLIQSQFKDSASLGFLDWNSEGLWYTVNGQKLHETGYGVWSKGQPDNAGNQHCGGVFRTGLLDDVWCDGPRLAFICEKAPESLALDESKK